MIKLNFENCLQLLLKVEDQSIEPDDIPLLKVKHEQWQQCLSINLFQLDKENKLYSFVKPAKFYNPKRIVEQGYLLIYLPHSVEQEIDAAWQQSPSKAWLLAGLAQSICYAAATKILGAQTCLALPPINDELAKFMNEFGMLKAGHLNYKFALFSFYPAQASCDFCALKANCPKI